MKTLVIPTSKDKYYRQLLEFLRPIKPFSKLNNKDLDILAALVTEYMGLKGLKHEQRCQYIFSTDVRKKVAKDANVSTAAFNNSISKIKKVGLIEDKIYFARTFIINMRPQQKIEIVFRWKREKQ